MTMSRSSKLSSVDKYSKSRTVLNAVALQDHLVKSLSLQDSWNSKVKQHKYNSKNFSKTKKGSFKSSTNNDSNKEYVLDEEPKPLTLAQKLGLVEAPSARLTDKQWRDVKTKSNKRNDSGQPCVICKEEFRDQSQVLLSCSHVFHLVCLRAFEKFSGGKTCPMCRKEQYETRLIHEGRKLWRHKCAIKIQSRWRGYVIRSWYVKLRKTVPPNDPLLRKKFFEEKVSALEQYTYFLLFSNAKQLMLVRGEKYSKIFL
ncbi:RING finger protein 32-like [Xenia sp. Carnegie-2017]|uniref:RING finger protein 32-like n=1 Tax=Xenia sp. Carnegie-2017 TaxID=2897299 RepID=UPI001F038096|nr:RING finger protein 32-like [Xenia sp. Carnegie-2017]